jgi:hypothetical protein
MVDAMSTRTSNGPDEVRHATSAAAVRSFHRQPQAVLVDLVVGG